MFGCRFNGALSLELSNDHPNRRIIHRKVAMILGHWVSEVVLFYFGFTIFYAANLDKALEEIASYRCVNYYGIICKMT